ncbi:MAG: histidine phosphatase family protein, partial [Gammaproteobacteria bacterium]|nr:histidine phosphatase family protein [Gammaproteobacteria bacterium]
MRILTLVRHAKSSWNDADLRDFDRPLNNRGLKTAPEMGKRLAEAGYKVDIIISSPAIR